MRLARSSSSHWLFPAFLPLLLSILLSGQAMGQNQPFSGGNGVTVVTFPSVDPNRLPSSGPYPVTYWVRNSNATSVSPDFSCSVAGPVSCTGVTPASATVPAGDSVAVSLTYSTAVGTGSASVTLTASLDAAIPPTSSGARAVTVAPAGKGALTLLRENVDNVDRGLCLTTGAGEGAGISCGDLFLVQGMPAYRTIGRDRSLSLYYNSATATGLSLVPAWVMEPATIAAPTTIRVILTVNGTLKDSTNYTPPATTSCGFIGCADSLQVVVGKNLNWASLSTGYYPMTVTLRNVYPSAVFDSTISGNILVVNRLASEYGRGWSLLGVEQLITPADTTQRVWLAGDGSARVYHRGAGVTSGQLIQSGLTSFSAVNSVDTILTNTAWTTSSATATTAYVQADLGATLPQAVTSARVYAATATNATYDVQYSSNATTWTTVLAGFKPQAKWSSVVWSSVGAYRYWRLKVAANNGASSTIRELSFGASNNFYGAPGDAPDSLVRIDTLSTKWYRRPLKHGAVVSFDQTGRHRLTTNRVGAQTTFTWGTIASQTRLATITVPPNDATSRNYTFTWNATTALLDSLRDPGGRGLRATITGGNLLKLRAPGAADSLRFAYDARNVLIRRVAVRQKNTTKGDTAVTTFTYGNAARVTQVASQSDSAGVQFLTTVISPWDERGLSALAVTDSGGLATRIDGPLSGTADATDIWVDRFGQARRMKHLGLGTITRIWHDSASTPALVTKIAFPHPNIAGDSGKVVRLSWNPRGLLTEQRELTGHVRRSSTDNTIIGFGPRITSYKYSGAIPDSPDSVIMPGGRVVRYTYNSLGLTDSVTDHRGLISRFVYQATGPVTGIALSAYEGSSLTSFTYNVNGNMQTTKSPIGATTSYESDALGRVIAVYNPYSWKTGYTYDVLNRITRSEFYTTKFNHPTEPAPLPIIYLSSDDVPLDPSWGPSVATTYGLTVQGATDSVVDPRGVKRKFGYDALGRVVREIDDTGRVKKAFYSATTGLLDSVVMRNGLATQFLYDQFGRKTTMRFPSRIFTADEPDTGIVTDTIFGDTTTYTYDLVGHTLSSTNRWGTIRRSYFADGSEETTNTDVGVYNSFRTLVHAIGDSLIYSYDSTGARTRLKMIAEAGSPDEWRDSVLYRYNAQGDLDTLRACFGKASGWTAFTPYCRTFTFVWDSLGRRKTINYPNGAVISYAYDLQGIVTAVSGAKTLNDLPQRSDRFDFGYANLNVNAMGRVKSQSYQCHSYATQDPLDLPCGNGGATRSVGISYNIRGEQLLQVAQTQSVIVSDTTAYDMGGNLARRAQWDGGTAQLYVRNDFSSGVGSNRLASSIRTSTLTPWTLNYTYDADGARVLQEPTVVNASTIDQFRRWMYDAMGRQAGYVSFDWANNQAQRHSGANNCTYDPEGRVIHPCDYFAPVLAHEGNNVTRFGSYFWRFIHAPGVDEFLMGRTFLNPTSPPKDLYFVTDGQGRELTHGDSSGSFQSSYWVGGTPGWFRYAGMARNSSSFAVDRMGNTQLAGVSLFRNRSYDANSGRWLQEDPIGVAGGINLYQYNGNNPVMYTDPFGLCPENLRDTSGKCPGKLTVKEWNQVQESYDHMSPGVRHRTATRLTRGEIHGGSLGSDTYGTTDRVVGKHITINRDKGLFQQSVFGDKTQLPKTLIHEDQHVTDLANRPAYKTPGEAYLSAREWYEARADAAEEREYVP